MKALTKESCPSLYDKDILNICSMLLDKCSLEEIFHIYDCFDRVLGGYFENIDPPLSDIMPKMMIKKLREL